MCFIRPLPCFSIALLAALLLAGLLAESLLAWRFGRR